MTAAAACTSGTTRPCPILKRGIGAGAFWRVGTPRRAGAFFVWGRTPTAKNAQTATMRVARRVISSDSDATTFRCAEGA
jgi:hypothetical protein